MNATNATDWSDVRERLERLAAHPESEEVFGAGAHGWRLEPPLSTVDLDDLERFLQVELPAEYRSFLLDAGSGGAGPAYGLFPVQRKDGRWQWEGDGATLTDVATLARPFPHTEAFNPADDLPEPPDELDFDTTEEFNAAEDLYWEAHAEIAYDAKHSIGLLYLCHLGCAYHEVLVVSGPSRGQMWADDTADDCGFRPLTDESGAPLGFAGWYRQWLDGAEARLARPEQTPAAQ